MRSRHRDHYTAMAALLDAPAGSDYEQRIEQAEIEIDNLRAAFGWSRENSDIELRVGAGVVAAAAVAGAGPHSGRAGLVRRRPDRRRHAACRGGARGARAGAGRQSRARLVGGRCRQPGSGRAGPGDRARDRRPGPAGPGAGRLRLRRRLQRRGWPGRTSPRRSAWPGSWTIGGGSARSSACRRRRRSPRATRSRRARPPKKDATSPTRSVTGSTRATAACASDGHSYRRAIWPQPSHNSREVVAEAEAAHDDDPYGGAASRCQGIALACQGDDGCGPGRGRRQPSSPPPSLAAFARALVTRRWGSRPWPPAMLGPRGTRPRRPGQHVSVRRGTAAHMRAFIAQAALAGGDLIAARRWADEAVATAPGGIRWWR